MDDGHFNRYWRWITASIAACLMLTMGFGLIWMVRDDRLHEREDHLVTATRAQAATIDRLLTRPISAALILGSAVRAAGGRPENFSQLATTMVDSLKMITNLQLAPAGVIADIYPLQGHEEALGRNLLRNDARPNAAEQTLRERRLTIAGPVKLIQGGTAFVLRNPVFLPADSRPTGSPPTDSAGVANTARETEIFWGFATALVELDLLLQHVDFASLAAQGMVYRLVNLSPRTGDPEVIHASTPEAFIAAETPHATVELDGEYYNWQLQVAYADPNIPAPYLWPSIFAVIIATLLLFFLAARMLFEPARLQNLVQQKTREVRVQGEQLRHSQQRLQYIFDNVADGVLSCDGDGIILSANRAASQMFGYEPGELKGLNVDTLVPQPMRAAHDEGLRIFRETGAGQIVDQGPVELLALHKDGTQFPIELNLKLVTSIKSDTLVATIRDLSELKRTQTLLFQAQKMEATGQLTGGIAHDFNNILSIITGNLDLATRVTEDSKLKKWLDQASTAAWRGADLVKQLLAFSSRQPLSPEPLAVDDLLAQMGQVLKRVLPESITVHLDSNCGCWVQADRAQFESMLINLANNARDAMPDGGSFALTTKAVHLREQSDWSHGTFLSGDYVQISVTDTGVGIDEAIRNHIYEPFFSTKVDQGGSGLGLSMVFGFVRQSGGHIELDEDTREGARFAIYLPRVRAPDQPATVVNSSTEALTDVTVLVVEDEAQILSVVRQMLQYSGCRVLSASNSTDALATLDMHPEVDLLLTDVILAEPCRGTQLAERARQKYPQLPVIYMSGYNEEAFLEEGAANGMLLQKPFLRKDLNAAIQAAIAAHSGGARSGAYAPQQTST